MKAFPFLFLLFLATFAQAQERAKKISPSLAAYTKANPNKEVNLFVRGSVHCVAQQVEGLGGLVKMNMSNISSVRIEANKIAALAQASCVQSFEFDLHKPYLLNDSSRVHSQIQAVNDGNSPLPSGFDGSGVVMGIIDTGLDMDHPDFQNADGSTRVVKFWDQTKPVNANTPAQYGYGQVCDSAAINAGTCTFGEQGGSFGHGTTVTGTASGTGNANGLHKGGAPGADLIIVSSKFNDPNWTATVADAVEFIVNEAEALGMPAVINASLGDYLGSHDGQDAAAQFIDSLLMAKEGRVMVCASGNSFGWPLYHMGTNVSSDTTFTWFKYNSASALGYGSVFFEAWADTAGMNNVQFAVGADKVNPDFEFRGRTAFRNIQNNIGFTVTDTLFSTSGNVLAVVDHYAELRGGQYRFVMHMNEPDSNTYNFRFMTTGSGRYDVWTADFLGFSSMETSLPTPADFPDIVNYVMPDDNQTMVSSWACSDQVITTANYYNEVAYTDVNGNPQTVTGVEGAISSNSSAGPTRDGRIKPDIAAPGDITITAAPFQQLTVLTANEPFKVAQGGMHIRQGGTSIASPVVAAAAALYLEMCSKASHLDVKSALQTTALTDGFTGAVPNTRWGAGKIQAFDAMIPNVYTPAISVFGDSALCPGDSVLISGPLLDSFLWSTGDTSKVFWLTQGTNLSLVTSNQLGCFGYSDTIAIASLPGPSIPTISASGNVITSSSASQYQWLFEGGPLSGETNQSVTVNTTGNYQVLISDSNGCTAISDTVFYLNVGVDDSRVNPSLKVWPSPTQGSFNVQLPSGKEGRLRLFDLNGKLAWENYGRSGQKLTCTKTLAPGVYSLVLEEITGTRMVERVEVLPQ